MKPRIKSVIWNIRKQKTTNKQNKKEKESKKYEDKFKQPLRQLYEVQHSHHKVARRRRKRARSWKYICKIIKDNFPHLVNEIDMQVLEAHRVPNEVDAKRPTPRHIIIKIPKVKDKQNLKISQEKISYLQGSSHKTVS